LITLLKYDVIPIPDAIEPELEMLIDYGLNLLETNLEKIENNIESGISATDKWFAKKCGCHCGTM
jgi:hypothetical protein